jgi:hypothetical protein
LRIIENPNLVGVEKPRHSLGVAHARKRPRHRHPIKTGQHPGNPLVVAFRNGLVATRSGEVTRIFDGVVVHACPKEEHWHGAMPDSFMSHLSCTLGGDTEVFDEVTEEDSLAAVEKARQGDGLGGLDCRRTEDLERLARPA